MLGGDSDVGDFMMKINLRYWWKNHYVGDFFNLYYRSPTT